jgi:uncharacterized membrane protein
MPTPKNSNKGIQRQQRQSQPAPPQPRGSNASQSISITRREMSLHSGPIPDAQTLIRYEEIVPGSARDIIGVFVEQSKHRRTLELKALESDIRNSERGQWFALIVAFGFMALSAVALFTGQEIAAAVIGSIDIVGIVSTFAIGTFTRQQERKDRLRLLLGEDANQA